MKNTILCGVMLITALIAVPVLLSGCGCGEQADSLHSRQLVIGVSQEPDSLNRLFMSMMVSTDIYFAFSRDLVQYDSDWVLQPAIAEQIPSLENGLWELLDNEDGPLMRTTWKIREDAVWEDGQPVVADDFILAFNVAMNDELEVLTRDVERRIESMEAPDSKTLVVNWKELYAYADQGHRKLPAHILAEEYYENPASLNDHRYNRQPLSNGPYTVSSWEPGSYVTLTRNPKFLGSEPWFERLVYRIIPNTNTLEANIASDTIQAITTVGLTMDQGLAMQRRHEDAVKVHFTDGLVWEHIDCNLDSEILSDKRVRQALMYGMNREKIMDRIFDNRLPVAHSWLPENHYGFNDAVRMYSYNPGMASRLLEEAGWKLQDGQRIREKNGKPLKLVFMTTAGNRLREQIQQILQSQWREIGIEVEIRNQPAKVFFGETMRRREFPHLALYAWVMSPISDGESLWTIKNIPSEENNWHGRNRSGWRNEEADRIDNLVPTTICQEERRQLLARQQEIWTEELPALPIYFEGDVSATRRDLLNWLPTGTQTPVTWNCEMWMFER